MNLFLFITKQFIVYLLFILSFLGLGRLILKQFKVEFESKLSEFFYASCIGIAICILFIFALSLMGLIYKQTLLILLCGLIGIKGYKPSKKDLYVLLGIFALTIPIFYLNCYPPINWDSYIYHLPHAQALLDNHKLTFNPILNRYPIFPLNAELLFTLGLSINLNSASLICLSSLLIIIIGCYEYVQKRYSTSTAIITILLLLSNTIIITAATECWVDIILTLFITASILAVIDYFDNNKEKKYFYISAAMLGIAIGIKCIALVFGPIIGLIIIYKTKNYKLVLKYASVVLILGGFWYLRNIYYTGNPVWPFLYKIFPNYTLWSVKDYANQFADFSANSINKGLINFLTLPAFFIKNEYDLAKSINSSLICWIGFIIYCLSLLKKDKTIKKEILLILSITIFSIIWFLSIGEARYYMPIFPTLCILSAIGLIKLASLINNNKLYKAIIICTYLILTCSYLNCIRLKLLTYCQLPPSTQIEIKSFNDKFFVGHKQMDTIMNAKGKTYGLMAENLGYLSKGKVIGDLYGAVRFDDVIKRLASPDKLYYFLRKLNVDYLLINKTRFINVYDFENQEKQYKNKLIKYYIDFHCFQYFYYGKIKLNNHFVKVYEDSSEVLYKLK